MKPTTLLALTLTAILAAPAANHDLAEANRLPHCPDECDRIRRTCSGDARDQYAGARGSCRIARDDCRAQCSSLGMGECRGLCEQTTSACDDAARDARERARSSCTRSRDDCYSLCFMADDCGRNATACRRATRAARRACDRDCERGLDQGSCRGACSDEGRARTTDCAVQFADCLGACIPVEDISPYTSTTTLP